MAGSELGESSKMIWKKFTKFTQISKKIESFEKRTFKSKKDSIKLKILLQLSSKFHNANQIAFEFHHIFEKKVSLFGVVAKANLVTLSPSKYVLLPKNTSEIKANINKC